MTTDPTPLHERIARALWDHGNAHMTPEWRDMAWNDMGGGDPAEERVAYELRAAAILPIIASEVRKAQADAWEKGKGDGLRQADYEYGARNFYAATNPYREQED